MIQVKCFPKYLASLLLRILAAILAGTLLLSAVCMLPSGPMDRNLERSADTFAREGIYPVLFPWCTSQLDSNTDGLILLISACDSGANPIIQAMSGTRNKVPGMESADDEVVAHYADGIAFTGTSPYYQYWHGYQVIIRPLLSLFSYPVIRILNGIAQTALLLVLFRMLKKRDMGRYILPYLAVVLMLMPLVLAMSLQFSSCYYLLTLGSIAVLMLKNTPDRRDGFLFLYIGIATAFFDFLTYPVATLGIPAVFYFCLRKDCSIRNTFCRGVKICFSWAVGYAGMWAGKWGIGSLILGGNVLTAATEALVERSSADSGLLHNIRTALSANIRTFLYTPATVVCCLLVLWLLVVLAKRLLSGTTNIRNTAGILFPFAVLAVLPIAWYLVTSQHAVVHYWFTNKALAVSAFAVLAGLAKASQQPE